MLKIVHISTVHPRYDNRILHKECMSLKNYGYDVSFVVADGKKDEEYNGIHIFDIGIYRSRLTRMLFAGIRAFLKANKLKPDIYHFHDPEMLIIAYFFALMGKNIIYDSHEDVPVQIKNKTYINRYIRNIISNLFNFFEKKASKRFKGVVCASPFITEKFLHYNRNSYAINNFPILGMFDNNIQWNDREDAILFVGTLTRERGIKEVIEALAFCKRKITFYLGGNFYPASFKTELESLSNYKQVKYLGYVYKEEYISLISKSKIGIITDYPLENYLDAFATKMFDYMEAGIPFICSHFPKWVDFVNKYHCGIAVDPFKPKEIASAINYLMDNPFEAKKLGANGKRIIKERYNWQMEEKKLIELYKSILSS